MSIKSLIIKLGNLNINLNISGSNILIDAPKGNVSKDILLAVKENKEEIINYLQDIKNQKKYASIRNVSKKEYYPLSSAQKRLYFLQQMDLTSTVYNIPYTIQLEESIEKEKLEESFKKLINRHESLRTSFEVINERPYQKINNNVNFKINYIESEANKIEEIRNNLIQPFDLTQAPLLRVSYLDIKDDQNLLILDMHHIITDGISQEVLEQEFQKIYSGTELTPLKLQYKDYSEWLNSIEQRELINRQKNYWIEKLSDELPVLNLPIDYSRPPIQSFEGASVNFILNNQETKVIRAISDQTGTTLYMSILAIFNILISKLSSQEDIIVGTPVATRHHSDLEKIVGMFVNILAMRNYPVGEKTVKQFLQDVKQSTLDAYENQEYQFEDIVGNIELIRDTSRNPVFDIVFNLLSKFEYNKGILEISEDLFGKHNKGESKFDLKLTAIDYEENLFFNLEYSTRLFNHNTIDRFIRHFKQIINQLSKEIGQKISEIEIITEKEKQQILYEFNSSKSNYPKNKTIHELFEEQTIKTPEKISIENQDESLTYKLLNSNSNHLALELMGMGVSSNCIVGIMLNNSKELLISVLGVLKSGGAYLPIDINQPTNRINYIIEDSNLDFLITTEKFNDKNLGITNNISIDKIIYIEDFSFNNKDVSNPKNNVAQTDISYLIYTSGSTGKPKGTLVHHQALVNYIYWASKVYYIKNNMNFPLYSSISFDLTVTSIYTPLITGNKIIVCTGQDITEVLKFIFENREIGIVKLTPSHLRILSQIMLKKTYVRKIIIGGDKLPVELCELIHEKFNENIEQYNEYGPTETVVGCMIYKYNTDLDKNLSVPIGKPASNTQIYILDNNLKALPVGVSGEMYIGGDCVSIGYLNNPEATQERYMKNLISLNGNMYKSGDMARMLPDYNIEFLRRKDNQVKIRGFRVEPGEIENKIKEINKYLEKDEIDTVSDPNSDKRCVKCLLTESCKDVEFDESGICNICHEYEKNEDAIRKYFKNEDDFSSLIKEQNLKNKRDYDCLLLFSGGKDSTYVLYKLVEMGLKVLAFTFDNKYISKIAFKNIKNITESLGVDSIVLDSKNMNNLFVQSIISEHNVCNGCWHALNTIAINLAVENNINTIISGLSRGQIVELRLEGLFNMNIYEEDKIENELLLFRKNYHSKEKNRFAKLLDIDVKEESIEQIQFIDFFRYFEASPDNIRKYLLANGWIQPEDTGFCSSNCLINDAGIYVHLKDLKYHSYAIQTSWDVRLKVLSREEALDEMIFDGDLKTINKIIKEIGYYDSIKIKDVVVIDKEDNQGEKYLCAYIVLNNNKIRINNEKDLGLRDYLSKSLPYYMIPSYFIQLDKIPLTPNGKINIKALALSEIGKGNEYIAPTNNIEEKLVAIWADVFSMNQKEISIDANFFELGGHSLRAILLIAKIHNIFDVNIPVVEIFKKSSIREVAALIDLLLLDLKPLHNNKNILKERIEL